MKTIGIITGLVILAGLLTAVAAGPSMTATVFAQQQQPIPGYSYVYPIPQMNNTTPQPPANNGTTMTPPADNGTTAQPPADNGTTSTPPQDNGTTSQPPEDNGTTAQPPADNGTTTTPSPADNATIFISAKSIHSTDIGNNTVGVRVLPPVPGFEWDGDVLWQSTGNVTLVAIQSDGTTSVSQESSSGALHFTSAALEFQSPTGQPVDVTYTVQAHLQNAPGP